MHIILYDIMKYITTGFFFLISFMSVFEIVQAQNWQSLEGPPYLETSATLQNQIITQRDSLYAIPGEGNIFKKAINNSQWIYVDIGGSKDFKIDDEGNYYSVDFEVVLPTAPPVILQNFSYSEDYGQTWNRIENISMGVEEIFITQTNEVLLAGGGFFKLSEDKNSFQVVDSTFTTNTIYQYNDTLIAGGFRGLSFSPDSGKTWQPLGPDSLHVQSITSHNNKILFSTNRIVYVQDTLGSTAQSVSGLPDTTIHIVHSTENETFLGTDEGIYSIDVENLTASPAFPELEEFSIFSLDSKEEYLYAGTNNGFYQCSVTSNTCQSDPPPATFVQDITMWNDQSLLTVDFQGISSYNIEEAEWDALETTFSGSPDFVHPVNETSFLVSTGSWLYTCSFNTDSCSDSLRVDPDNSLQHITENEDGILFANSYKNVFMSNDRGESWDVIYTKGRTGPNFGYIWKTFPYADSLLFIASTDSLIKHHISDDTFYSVGFEGYWDIDFTHSDNGTLFMNANTEVYKSTDTGETWGKVLDYDDIEEDYGNINKLLYDNDEEKLYAIFSNGPVFVSDNDGENWGVDKEFFQTLRIEDAILDSDGKLYLASNGAGVFTNTQPLSPPITISNEEEPEVAVPDEIALHQNYPNPFNPSTTIRYSIPEAGEVRLTVYNVVGQEVAVLLNRIQNQGIHTIQFDAGHLASGLYLYRLETKNFSETRKMMLVK